MASVYSHHFVLSISSRAAKQLFVCFFNENVISFNSLFSIILSNYILSIGDKGELLSMNDTALHALETATALSGDRTNEPVLWQQMCPDRYKQSQLWVFQADPRGLSKGKEPSGT